MEKRRLRMVQFSGDLLHPTGIGRFVQDANPGRVPPEGVAGKSIDNVQFVTHKTGLVCRSIKHTGVQAAS